MLLEAGTWDGRGRLWAGGGSIGQALSCELDVRNEEDGWYVSGTVLADGQDTAEVSLRIVASDDGTYQVDSYVAGVRLDGTAKLDSLPNLALLWHEEASDCASVALFRVERGFGCRGFYRSRSRPWTWEIAFQARTVAKRRGNVVPLRR